MGTALQVGVIGSWSERGGRKRLGSTERVLLHALSLCREGIYRKDLYALLPNPEREPRKLSGSLRQDLSQLKHEHGIAIETPRFPRGSMLKLVRPQPSLEVDLWNFVRLVEEGRYPEAKNIILDQDRALCVPEPWDGETGRGCASERLWFDARNEFQRALAQLETSGGRAAMRSRAMRDTHQRLLSRRLVPGFDPPFTINDVRELLAPLPSAWKLVHAPEQPEHLPASLPVYLHETLGRINGASSQMIVRGSPGYGKELTAIASYLLLTDDLMEGKDLPGQRTVLFVDARTEHRNEDFATDAWLRRRLVDAGADPDERPIVIMPHADLFFMDKSRERLAQMRGWRLFGEVDTLLCCNEQFYAKILDSHGYGTHEVRLEDWDTELQDTYVRKLHGMATLERYIEWRRVYESRGTLCEVPLHLHYVVGLIADEDEALSQMERRWQLYERVAKVRMESARLHDKDTLLEDLGSLAHRYYVVGEPSERSISFSDGQLREHLKRRGVSDVGARVRDLTQNTVLDSDGLDQWRFHDLPWGWFFVAYHLLGTLKREGTESADVLHAFGQFLSAPVMDRCEEMLRSWPERDYTVMPALLGALESSISKRFVSGRARVAREQVGYLLGVLAGDELCAELEPRLDPADARYESDAIVRRGIAIGLSNNDAVAMGVADRYVDQLRAEVAAGEDTPQADANIGCVLSFRGDRPFDYEHPEAYGVEPDPTCTVADLITGLENSRHKGTWRIKLFTLLDIARRVSPEPFRTCIAEHRNGLEAVLDKLSDRMTEGSWPEIEELRAVLSVIPPAANRAK